MCYVRQIFTMYLKSTLQDRVKGRVKHGEKPGLNTYLTSAEEEESTSFLTEVAKIGYSKTRKEVKHLVEAVARQKADAEKRNG